VYFHGSPVFRFVKGNYSKDIIATLPFLSVLFATIVTRTGLLQSVHAFGLSTSDYIIIVFLLGLVVVETFFIFKLYRKSEIKFFYSIDELKTIKRQDAALYISFFSFFLGTIAIMTGLIIPLFFALLPEPFNQSFIMDKKYFNIIIGIFGFGALEAAFFTDYVFIKTDKNKLALISIGVFLGIINAFLNLPIVIYELKKANIGLLYDLLHILGTTSLLANFMLPIIVMSLVILLITVYKFAKSTEIQKQVKMRKVSQTILHLGIIIALFGALVSYNSTQNNNVLLQPNGSGFIDVTQKTELKILDFQYEQDGLNFNRKLQAYVQVVDNGQVLGSGILHYTEYIDFGLIVNVLIISSVTSDYYLTIMTFTANENTQTVSDIRFQIRTIPMIGFLWLGSLIVLIAMVALVVISLKLFKFSYKKSQGMILSSKNILPANEISI
jgi:cytochrome c-type biogenesis protein CcmF